MDSYTWFWIFFQKCCQKIWSIFIINSDVMLVLIITWLSLCDRLMYIKQEQVHVSLFLRILMLCLMLLLLSMGIHIMYLPGLWASYQTAKPWSSIRLRFSSLWLNMGSLLIFIIMTRKLSLQGVSLYPIVPMKNSIWHLHWGVKIRKNSTRHTC